MTTRPGDEEIRAADIQVGDELHLTVMGGDEYVTVETKETDDLTTTWSWTSWGGRVEDTVPNDTVVWVKKRGLPANAFVEQGGDPDTAL